MISTCGAKCKDLRSAHAMYVCIHRRRKSAAADVQKQSVRTPRDMGSKPKKRKNIEHGQFGERTGRVHMKSQDMSQMGLANLKGLKKRKATQGIRRQQSCVERCWFLPTPMFAESNGHGGDAAVEESNNSVVAVDASVGSASSTSNPKKQKQKSA